MYFSPSIWKKYSSINSDLAQALQLVRAVATVLRLSKKDEYLIRQKVEERRSWFNTPVVAAKSSGQFAKMLPPS
ncbi:unnamed protein product [Rodentolepis nana]|uniref:Uncharacterized protein n=1 Tax=Rodentolepis nana TaxID=102285 RepID=A0A0R3TEC9_RODNA|nr:unnamed protein product [Rodentolepis nana]